MKRSDRNKAKTDSDQRHPDPHQPAADNHERHISGSINIRGEIETKRPPDLTKEHETERKEDKADDRKKFIVEILTLGAVVIYAWLTAWQACTSYSAYISANMPSVGVSMIEVRHLSFDANRRPIQSESRTDKTVSLGFVVTIKNSGTVTAENFAVTWKAFINGEEQPVMPSPSRPTKMLPGREIKLTGQTGDPTTYLALMTGKDVLALEITVSYDDPKHKRLAYCERNEYDYTIDAFKSLGACP